MIEGEIRGVDVRWSGTRDQSQQDLGASADKIPLMIEIGGKSTFRSVSPFLGREIDGTTDRRQALYLSSADTNNEKGWHWKHKAWHMWRRIGHTSWHVSSLRGGFTRSFDLGWVLFWWKSCRKVGECKQKASSNNLYQMELSHEIRCWQQWKMLIRILSFKRDIITF